MLNPNPYGCDICGSYDYGDCDQSVHIRFDEDQRLELLAESVVCTQCHETITDDGCPCGAVEPYEVSDVEG
ncbi:MAG: hypothetical protein HRU00_17185 [Myxococcales bacterium]|nr:hypothetical protein [Myxococcales bacterium]